MRLVFVLVCAAFAATTRAVPSLEDIAREADRPRLREVVTGQREASASDCRDPRRAFSLARALREDGDVERALVDLATLAACADPAVALEAVASALRVAEREAYAPSALGRMSANAVVGARYVVLAADATRPRELREGARAVAELLTPESPSAEAAP